jgi:CRP-like cAMP-binding protein
VRARSAYVRVAVAISELVRLLGLKGERYIAVPHRIPRWFLASYAALSPETVSRNVTRLRKEGLIAFSKRRLVIASLAKLDFLKALTHLVLQRALC